MGEAGRPVFQWVFLWLGRWWNSQPFDGRFKGSHFLWREKHPIFGELCQRAFLLLFGSDWLRYESVFWSRTSFHSRCGEFLWSSRNPEFWVLSVNHGHHAGCNLPMLRLQLECAGTHGVSRVTGTGWELSTDVARGTPPGSGYLDVGIPGIFGCVLWHRVPGVPVGRTYSDCESKFGIAGSILSILQRFPVCCILLRIFAAFAKDFYYHLPNSNLADPHVVPIP